MAALSPNRAKPLAAALYTHLRDGQWHDLEETYLHLAKHVTPEKAVGYRRLHRSGNAAIRIGQGRRDAARNAVHAAKLAGHVERDGNQIRLTTEAASRWNEHLDQNNGAQA